MEAPRMIKHIVMFKFKDISSGRNKEENIQLVKESLQSLPQDQGDKVLRAGSQHHSRQQCL